MDSFGGNSKTCLVTTISPSAMFLGETLLTLDLANKAMLIKNTAIVNEDTSDNVEEMRNEIKRLVALLNAQSSPTTAAETKQNQLASSPKEGSVFSTSNFDYRPSSLLENVIMEKKKDEAAMVCQFEEGGNENFKKNEGKISYGPFAPVQTIRLTF
jgi:hypothetical protein